jgi:hypothetical protein
MLTGVSEEQTYSFFKVEDSKSQPERSKKCDPQVENLVSIWAYRAAQSESIQSRQKSASCWLIFDYP